MDEQNKPATDNGWIDIYSKPCEKCHGDGWVYGYELTNYCCDPCEIDETEYTCDLCCGTGKSDEPNDETKQAMKDVREEAGLKRITIEKLK